jgi:hypothetical protein
MRPRRRRIPNRSRRRRSILTPFEEHATHR